MLEQSPNDQDVAIPQNMLEPVAWTSLPGIVQTLRRRWLVPVIGAIVFLALACVYLAFATPLYQAKITITARAPQSNAQLGRLASFGLSLLGGRGGNLTEGLSNYDQLIEVIGSEEMAADLMSDNSLMKHLFSREWDSVKREWRRPQGVIAKAKAGLDALFGLPSWSPDSADPVVSILNSRFKVVSNEDGASYTLFVEDVDPKYASQILMLLLDNSDELLRMRDRRINSSTISFLRNELQSEQVVDVREALAERLAGAYVNRAILAGNEPYSYDVVKDLYVSSRPVTPRPLLTLVLSIVAGTVLGVAVIILDPRRYSPPAKGQRRASGVQTADAAATRD